jgi:DNA repair protein RadD
MLYDFQNEVKAETYTAWREGAYNVMPVMPTGSGKTVTFCDIVKEYGGPSCLISHRQELVGQAALALNRERVEHSIIAPQAVVKQIIALEHEIQGHSCYNSRAQVRAAGVDTIIRHDTSDRWYSRVGLVVQDEGHHVLSENKWGRAQLMFPNARGLFPTAHAVRADGKGLGREADGLVDRVIKGPHGRYLINRGFLTDYRVICVGSDIDFSDVTVSASGDFSAPKLRAATHKSNRIVGDVVKTYLRFAPGKLGVTFAVDIEAATELRNAYQAAGVPAEVITSETPLSVRGALMRKFRARQIIQLVSVDCLGEGVDVPAIEVVSMVRKTASWQLFCQQFGRALRVMVGEEYFKHWPFYTDEERLAIIAASQKSKAIIIDHVGNVIWHAEARGLPDTEQEYSLLRRSAESRGKSDAIPLRGCLFCFHPFERYLIACPNCGGVPIVAGRGSPELVEGDLIELEPGVLQALRGEVERVNGPLVVPAGADAAMRRGLIRSHHDRYKQQQSLQKLMALWGGWQNQKGLSTREAQKLFYIRYGVDVMSAQTLGANDAAELEARIFTELQKHNVYEVQP